MTSQTDSIVKQVRISQKTLIDWAERAIENTFKKRGHTNNILWGESLVYIDIVITS